VIHHARPVPHQYLQIMFIGGSPLINCNRLCGFCDLSPSRTRPFLPTRYAGAWSAGKPGRHSDHRLWRHDQVSQRVRVADIVAPFVHPPAWPLMLRPYQ
jgi:hypothetical protein